jgi:N-acyl-D-aspartate/D-glutamate deacylase
MAEHFDLLIRGGTLVDGSGAPGIPGDLAIRGGRIAALGEVRGDADRTLDAGGCVVAPGFVDIHTHYDAQVFWDRMLTISPWHGVTSVVMGNCGFGIAPTRPEHRDLILRTLESVEGMSLEALRAGVGDDWPFETFPEYLDAIERRGTAINVGALVGHTPLRLYVMGEEATEREATEDEIARMRQLVREALEAGAIGFGTSKAPTHVGYAGRPVPSRAASLAEIESLAGALGEAGRGFFLNELAAIGRQTGRSVSWTALLAGLFGPDGHRRVLEESSRLQAEGVDVVPQVSCRPLVVEFQFKAPFPFESLSIFKPVSAADFAGRKRIYADPEFRAAFRERSEQGVLTGRWSDMVITDCPGQPDLADRDVSVVAAERGVHPADLALDLSLASNLEARFRMPVANTDEKVVAELLQHPSTILGLSDAGAHATAERFGIDDRGRLAPGLAADVTVFDPETVGCSPLRRVRDFPAGADRLIADATGIRAVIVNGTPIRIDGEDVVDAEGDLPGHLLRGGTS